MLIAHLASSETKFEINAFSEKIELGETCFVLKSYSNPSLNIKVRFPLPVHDVYEEKNFECYPFISDAYYKENHIFELHEEDLQPNSRIGWIFPIQSLTSKEHDKAKNKHFLQYAYVTFKILLQSEMFKEDLSFTIRNYDDEIDLSNIYPSDLIIASLSKDKLKLISKFKITNYLHSLYINRYYFCTELNQLNQRTLKNLTREGQRIEIKRISKNLKTEVFILALFKDHLIDKNHPLVQFHFLYQIIELLIDKILDFEILKVLDSFKSRIISPHEMKKELQEITPEEHRIFLLLNSYSRPAVNNRDLVLACNKILIHFNRISQDIVPALYQVRSIVVHRFREITTIDPKYELLEEVNEHFELTVTQILSCYIEPNSDNNETDNLPLAWLMYQMLK